jgi:hypothetical protein
MKQEKDRKISQPGLDDLASGELGSDRKMVDECGRLSGTYPAGAASEPDPPLGAAQPPYPAGSFRVGLRPHRFRAGTTGCGQALSVVSFPIPLGLLFLKMTTNLSIYGQMVPLSWSSWRLLIVLPCFECDAGVMYVCHEHCPRDMYRPLYCCLGRSIHIQ